MAVLILISGISILVKRNWRRKQQSHHTELFRERNAFV
jgi:hypothetical protein